SSHRNLTRYSPSTASTASTPPQPSGARSNWLTSPQTAWSAFRPGPSPCTRPGRCSPTSAASPARAANETRPAHCQWSGCGGSGPIVVIALVGEQDALAEQVGFGASVHLSLDHLDAVDVAFDGAGAVGDGEPGGDGGPVLAESLAEAAQLADGAGLGLAGPGFQALAAAVAEHVRELADQVTGSCEFLAAAGDLRERGAVAVGEIAGRGEDPAGHLLRLGRWRRPGDGGVAAQPGGEPPQRAQAAPVAAVAQFGVQPFGAADPFVPALPQPVLVRAEQAR